MAKTERSICFILGIIPAVCILVIALLAANLLFARQARALPLCEETSGVRCREDVEAAINIVIESLRDGAPDVNDSKSGISDFVNALQDFGDARAFIANIANENGMELTVTDRCKASSDEDKRALRKTALGVADTSKLPADRFSSPEASTATRTALTALVRSMVEAVGNNLDEIEMIGGFDPDHAAAARKTLANAGNDLAQHNLARASN